MKKLEDRVAVVTGSASGIGLGIVEAFVGAGMRVMLADVDERGLERETARLREAGAIVGAVPTDVGDPASVDALAEATLAMFGEVHVICNNAGIVRPGRTWELSLEDWHDVLRVNLFGVIHGVRRFVPELLSSGDEGHVVNVASMAAVVPVPGIGPYNVSKHGVLALSEALQAELAAESVPVGVTVVMPGRVRTNLGRPSDALDEDVASVPLEPGVIEASDVGRQVVAAVRANRLHLFTHPDRLAEVRARFDRITDS